MNSAKIKNKSKKGPTNISQENMIEVSNELILKDLNQKEHINGVNGYTSTEKFSNKNKNKDTCQNFIETEERNTLNLELVKSPLGNCEANTTIQDSTSSVGNKKNSKKKKNKLKANKEATENSTTDNPNIVQNIVKETDIELIKNELPSCSINDNTETQEYSNTDSLKDDSTDIENFAHLQIDEKTESQLEDKILSEVEEKIESLVQKPVDLIQYESELQMPMIMKIIQKDLSEPYSIYTYRYFIHNWPKLCFLAMSEGQCVGAIVCKLDIHRKVIKRGYIAMLAVDKEFRKQHIGSKLVQLAIEEMVNGEADEVVLETEVTNIPALKLYEKLGFVRDKRLFRYYLNGVDALRLKLWLR